LHDAIRLNAYAAHDKDPLIMCDAFKESGASIFVGVWAKKDVFTELKRTMLGDVKNRLQAGGIDMSLPQIIISMKDVIES
jgi:hypothetical protein